jgi:ABC-type spermidine/putrescine transport system permease subunit I
VADRPPEEVRLPGGGERKASAAGPMAAVDSGVWYPRWYWPSFAAPATIWIAILFVLPFYVVISVAFGTVDPIFRNPLPVYQPWWWSGQQFGEVLSRFVGGNAIFLPAAVRTLVFVAAASAICLVLGYAVAYYVARYGGRRKGLFLVLLISPFWISYLMRIYAWQSLLTEDGYINDIFRFLHLIPTRINWLDGRPITVILGLVYGYIPYMILPIYGQLDRINQNLLEAGRDLGASPVQTFWRVTLPLSKQAILAGMVIVSLPMFGDYYTNDLLGSAKTAMYGNLIDATYTQPGQGPQAGALVIILIVLLMIPMGYYLRTTRKAVEEA